MSSKKYGALKMSVHPDPNLPLDGTQFQAAIGSDVPTTRMTLGRPKNARQARNPTLAKTNP
ncbi:hypothetical protein EV121DRAFT_298113 [Schizophyllum commune]